MAKAMQTSPPFSRSVYELWPFRHPLLTSPFPTVLGGLNKGRFRESRCRKAKERPKMQKNGPRRMCALSRERVMGAFQFLELWN